MTSPIQPVETLSFVGAVHIDDIASSTRPLIAQASNPVTWQRRVGGVAANAALAAVDVIAAAQRVELTAATGNDALADQLERTLETAGITPCLQRIPGQSTGRYSAIMDNTGELFIGLSDVGVAEHLDPALPGPCEAGEPGRALLMDANLSVTCLQALSERAASLGLPTAAMSVSPAKSVRLLSIASELQLLFCNRREAIALGDPRLPVDTDLDVLADTLLARGFNQFVLTDADSPVLVQTPSLRERLSVPTFTRTQHVNGAGDALAGASFAAWCAGSDLPDAVRRQGLPAAARILSGQRQPPCLLAGLKHIDTGT